MMPSQERLSWEDAGFGLGMVWWMGSYSYPPAVETRFCERRGEKDVAVPGGVVCTHDVAVPLLHPCTEQTKVKQGCEFYAVGDPGKRSDSVLNAASTL